MKFKGVVLAGGKSSRFGGDKALARWEGETLLERAVGLLRRLDLDPAVISNPSRDYSFLPCPVFHDLIPEKGPLGGIYTACSLFPETALLVLTCDMPFAGRPPLMRLMEAHRSQAGGRITIFAEGKVLQPFPGVYDAGLKDSLKKCLQSGSGEWSMKSFLSREEPKRILRHRQGGRTFQNVNRREEWHSFLP